MRPSLLCALCCCSLFAYGQRPQIPNLPYGSQQEVGFNVDSLNALEAMINDAEHRDFVGIVVIKDNQLVVEWYYNSFGRNHIHDIRSAGKSITSLLLGVAIKEGLVQSVEQAVYAFFPKEKYPNIHNDFKAIKIKHLLDMSAGLNADSDRGRTPGHAGKWVGREEWVQYLLSIPRVKKPGKGFVYADINAALVGAIIEETSGMSLRDFAKEKVFEPLGIKEYYWYTNAANQTMGSGTLYMSTLDFAKLGALVATGGKWGDEQIVAADYVERLLEHRTVDISENWSLADSYGMLWYKNTRTFGGREYDYLWAAGKGGNQLIVVPEENMVVAMTSSAYGPRYGHYRAYTFLEKLLGDLGK